MTFLPLEYFQKTVECQGKNGDSKNTFIFRPPLGKQVYLYRLPLICIVLSSLPDRITEEVF